MSNGLSPFDGEAIYKTIDKRKAKKRVNSSSRKVERRGLGETFQDDGSSAVFNLSSRNLNVAMINLRRMIGNPWIARKYRE